MHSQKRDTNKHFSVHTYYDISKKYITFAYMETRKIHSNISFKLILYCDENKNGTMHYFI